MYLNVNGQVGTNLASNCEENACTTPEIISTLITLGTTPMPGLSDDSSNGGTISDSAYLTLTSQHEMSSAVPLQGYGAAHPLSPQLHQQCYQTPVSPAMSTSSFSSQRSSPMCSSPPSIRTHLIKESLKVTIQNKRWANGQAIPPVDSTVSSYDEVSGKKVNWSRLHTVF